MAAQDNSRGLHPGQFAPMGGKLRLRLCKRIAHVRGGCTPGNSRLWVLVPSGDRPGPTEPAGETLAAARAHRATSARARPSAWAVNSRGLHPGQFAPGGGELRSRLYEPLARVRAGGISRAGPPVAKSKKRKGRGKRHWPSLFSLRGIIEEGRTCISRKGAVHFF